MKDADCVAFLQWALPQMRMRWGGFRKVRGQVCKRISRRMAELELPTLSVYRSFLNKNTGEWQTLSKLCRVTISRFYRDRGTFEILARDLLPHIAQNSAGNELRVWCAGCASGEEPYTLKILWEFLVKQTAPGIELKITATDSDPKMLERAGKACYPASSLRELPPGWKEQAFERTGNDYCLRGDYREGIEFLEQDIIRAAPAGSFHMVFCRNLVFTYFDKELQRECLERITKNIPPGGALLIGCHESLPPPHEGLNGFKNAKGIYIKIGGG